MGASRSEVALHTGVERLVAEIASRYRVEHEIGRGGWGVVYRARDLRLPRTVAIKVLKVDTADPDARERFRREIDFEARLVHPHIVPVIESGEVGDALYFVMPYVEGNTLREQLTQEGRLAIPDAIRIARQIAEGLAHAHERQIVHRDIKPANILLASGSAMIADFGIARALDASEVGMWTTSSGLRLGTPAYMSPEQSAGDPGLDARSDLYSLGCVLFEMLVGSPPYTSESVITVLGAHAVAAVPSMRAIRPEISTRLDGIVSRLLAKTPDARFSTARELIAELDVALVELQEPPAAAPPSRRARFALAAVVVLAIIGTIGLTRSASSRLAAHRESLADTTRVVLYPLEGDPGEREAATEMLRRAVARWQGVDLVDAFAVNDAVTEAVGDGSLSSRRAGTIARNLGAGRFIRGSVVRTDVGLELRAVLSSSGRQPATVAEFTERLPIGGWVNRDSLAARAVARLLFSGSTRSDTDIPSLRTAKVAAAQLYLAGRNSVDRWALDSAAVQLDEAWRLDPKFSEAALWLSLVRFWRGEAPANWLLPAQTVAQDSARNNDAIARRHAAALLALTEGDRPAACAEWEALTTAAPLDFSAWYSAALCRDRDNIVVRDPSAPTGWRFRSSFHTAQLYYLRAFQQLPTMHRALRDRAYERVRALLFLSANRVRAGRVATSGDRMTAFPVLSNDTLVLAPITPAQLTGADASVADLRRRSARQVVQQQRELFRDITSVWTSADPQSAEAREAQALALQMLGDAGALDTMLRARALATTPMQRRQLAATEVWMRVRLGVPDDRLSLRRARLLADSLLRSTSDDGRDDSAIAAAALAGRLAHLLTIERSVPMSRIRPDADGRAQLESEILALHLAAAVGAPDSELAARAWRVDSMIPLAVPATVREATRASAFSRAEALAYPQRHLPAPLLTGLDDDYLIRLIQAELEGDSTGLQRGIRDLIALRTDWSPAETTAFDALIAEAALLLRVGQPERAAAWLDAALRAQRQSAPEFDPVDVVSFVRAMVLRGQIAAQLGDSATARRWAGAASELWANADTEAKGMLSLTPTPRR